MFSRLEWDVDFTQIAFLLSKNEQHLYVFIDDQLVSSVAELGMISFIETDIAPFTNYHRLKK